jgi:hypothetical protein
LLGSRFDACCEGIFAGASFRVRLEIVDQVPQKAIIGFLGHLTDPPGQFDFNQLEQFRCRAGSEK